MGGGVRGEVGFVQTPNPLLHMSLGCMVIWKGAWCYNPGVLCLPLPSLHLSDLYEIFFITCNNMSLSQPKLDTFSNAYSYYCNDSQLTKGLIYSCCCKYMHLIHAAADTLKNIMEHEFFKPRKNALQQITCVE